MAKNLEKAVIRILKGRQANQTIEVLFNPAEYSIEYKNNYQETALPGLGNPVIQFVNGESQALSMELLFDTWTNEGGTDVQEYTKKITGILARDSDLHAPSPVEFRWGNCIFSAVIESVSQRFTMFAPDGTPVRATLSVSFKQYRPLNEQFIEPKLESSDRTKRRVLEGLDTLWMLANKEYGHPREWRRIARFNRVANPRELSAGDTLLLPPMEDNSGRR